MPTRVSIWRLFRVELRLFMREPAAVFFSLLFPAILGLIINAAIGHYKAVDGFRVSDVDVPAIRAIALANIGLMSVPIVIAEYKERAILKRYRTTPIPYLWIGRASGQQWTALVAMVAMAVGALIIARRTFRWT